MEDKDAFSVAKDAFSVAHMFSGVAVLVAPKQSMVVILQS